LDEVPGSEEERLEWLAGLRKPQITEEMHQSLVKWYGDKKAKNVKVAESFEICEYGRRPSDEEIKTLFPMLGEK
jgi:hypothetical protein